jgi:hypothetical protein
MWLTPKILEWETSYATEREFRDESWRRAYSLVSHAEHLLEQSRSELFRIDAITTLKRAVDHRLRLLDEIYEFRKIPIGNKPSGNLDLLDYLGIVRPKMVQKLIEIRNLIEHENTDPPGEEACFDFVEFTWYFLRSTDLLVRRSIQTVHLRIPEDESEPKYYTVGITFDPKGNWIPKLFAWVTPSMISEQPVNDWLTLKVESTITRGALVATSGEPLDPTGWDLYRGKNADDTHLEGEIRGPAHHLLKLYQSYFQTV